MPSPRKEIKKKKKDIYFGALMLESAGSAVRIISSVEGRGEVGIPHLGRTDLVPCTPDASL